MTEEPTGTEAPRSAPTGAEAVLARLRTRPASAHAFGGYGPLILAAILAVAMVLLAPSVAPEQVVERPVDPTTSTTLDLVPG